MNDNWSSDPLGVYIPAKLVSISEKFNAGQDVELKFKLLSIFFSGGELYLRVPPDVAEKYVIGEEYSMRLRAPW